MQVTIIGTGNMARGIGSRVLAGGHDLTVVGKDSERAEAVAADIGGDGTVKTAVAGDPIEGVVVVLAVYYPDARAAAQQYAHQLAGNTTFAGPLTSGDVAGHKLDVLIAGDDGDAKGKVAALARDGGLNPIDVGPLRRARELEAAGLLNMGVQSSLGTGFASALKIVA